MGFKLIAQLTLILAAVIIFLTFIQPSLIQMKDTQDELFQYSEAVSKASQFNARLRELIGIRDSFAQEDIDALERLLPTHIDSISVMRDIEAIFANNNVVITTLTADDLIDPITDIAIESPIVVEAQPTNGLAYQDFKVAFIGSYSQLRDILFQTEMSATLLEVIELSFGTVDQADADDEGDTPIIVESTDGEFSFTITYRTYALPVSGI
jgi:hypothetical protein